ncbi:hypothetical protein ACH5RR_034951 [Cinchona calisaya]|uniref:SKP1-like protein n=1 Tax=Cinchona calisaya TaxID=153742 RepID=A0ABD2YFZ0_9GENT
MSSPKDNILTLKSSDNVEFNVKESVAIQSVRIKDMVDKGCFTSNTICLPDIDSKILGVILEYLSQHGDSKVSMENQKEYDAKLADKPIGELFDLVLAVDYLQIKSLLDIICDAISNNIMAGLQVNS